MPDGSFPVRMVRGVPVVTAPGEIDITNAAGLRAALLDAALRGGGTFVVDMTGTRFCDSAGVHALVDAHKRAMTKSGAVLLAVAEGAVLRIVEITGLDRLITRYPTLESALLAASALTTASRLARPGSPSPPPGASGVPRVTARRCEAGHPSCGGVRPASAGPAARSGRGDLSHGERGVRRSDHG